MEGPEVERHQCYGQGGPSCYKTLAAIRNESQDQTSHIQQQTHHIQNVPTVTDVTAQLQTDCGRGTGNYLQYTNIYKQLIL